VKHPLNALISLLANSIIYLHPVHHDYPKLAHKLHSEELAINLRNHLHLLYRLLVTLFQLQIT